ncbi:uncharacterized protein LOC131802128 [Musca domestica]|uniref:Uncharacterized protein LOC131802128 n=1 Tax=Musca domestica TaxID=7370 RepID=A0ABM3UVH0_MUSDO|nr:uncharacterized protein LOC131802128 [Musca domestica]
MAFDFVAVFWRLTLLRAMKNNIQLTFPKISFSLEGMLSPKDIILIILSLICSIFSILTFILMQTNANLTNTKEILTYKIILVLCVIYTCLLKALIIKPIRKRVQLFAYVFCFVSIALWFLCFAALLWIHFYISSNYSPKCEHKSHTIQYYNTASFLMLGYVNFAIFSVICIAVIGNSYSLYMVAKK